MKKIKISISVNSIYFSFTNQVDDENINKTSYIETGNLLFEYDYLIKNHKIISSFIKDITDQTKINTIKIKHIALVPLILKIVKNNSTITKLYILDNKSIDTNSFLTIVDNKHIKYLNCYNMPGVMFNYLNERKDILIELRNEIPYTSNFIKDNKLTRYSTIYYKKHININANLDEVDLKDLETFLLINKHLQVINLNIYNLDTLKLIISLLEKFCKRKIKINIYQNNSNIKQIFGDADKIKKLKSKNLNIKVVYNKEYIFKNFFKQINISMLRFTFLAVFVSLIIVLSITEFTSAKEDKQTSEIVNDINEILENTNEEILGETIEVEFNDDTHIEEQETTTEENKPVKPNAYKTEYEKVFSKLKEINKDTVGWLTVKNTSVDYPVVQYSDNDYYLKHSFDNKKNTRGWIFADYRNNFEPFDDNTIIYGHNLKSGYMFGTLQKVLAPEWYNNKDNLTITFNTINGNYSWQIFSIYTMEKTNEYLVSTFASEMNFNNYVAKSKEKSIIDFKVDVNYGDNILTLSTCYIDSNHRLVIQAKLIK